MTYMTLPDVEALAVAHLLADTGVTDLVDTRVGTELPQDPTFPRIVVRRVGGAQVVEQYLERARLQVDAYAGREVDGGGGKEQAHDVIREAQRALHEARLAAHADAVVTDVATEVQPVWSPDPETDRPRYRLQIALTVHPTAGS